MNLKSKYLLLQAKPTAWAGLSSVVCGDHGSTEYGSPEILFASKKLLDFLFSKNPKWSNNKRIDVEFPRFWDQRQVPSEYKWTARMCSESWIVFTRSEKNKYKFCSCSVHISNFGNCMHALTALQFTAKPASRWYNGLCCIWKDQYDQLTHITNCLYSLAYIIRRENANSLGSQTHRKSVLPVYSQMCCCHGLSRDSSKWDANHLLPYLPSHFLLQGWSWELCEKCKNHGLK